MLSDLQKNMGLKKYKKTTLNHQKYTLFPDFKMYGTFTLLVGGFNPSENISKMGSFPQGSG